MSDIQAAGSISSQRMLKWVVIGLGALIVIALGFVVIGIVAKFSHPSAPATAAVTGTFALPPGAKLIEMQAQQGRVILHLHTPAGDEVDILDTEDGHLVARIK